MRSIKGFTRLGSWIFDQTPTAGRSRMIIRNQNKIKGFTLIELLVVIAVISLLSSVVLASLSTARMKARDARRIADLDQIRTALEMFFDANGYYPGTDAGTGCAAAPCWDIGTWRSPLNGSWSTSLQSDLSPYISRLPVDPIGTSCGLVVGGSCYSYWYGHVGRFGINPGTGSTTVPNTYDLLTRLETPGHPLSCQNRQYTWQKGSQSPGFDLCLAAPPARQQLYVVHP